MALLITPGQWGDAPQMIEVLDRIRVPRPLVGRPRTRPDHVSGDKAYSSRRNRSYLRRRRIKHTIPEPRDQRAHRLAQRQRGRQACFDRERYRRRNEVERTINRLKNSRAVGEVDSGRPAGVSTSGFPPSRLPNPACPSPGTGLSTNPVPGCSVPHAVVGHGAGMSFPRYRYLVVLTLAGLNSSDSSVTGHQPPP